MPGVRISTQVSGGLVRTRGQPVQIVLGGPDYAELAKWRDRLLAAHRGESRPRRRRLRLQGNAPADARADRSPARVGPRRERRIDRPRAGNDDGLAARHDLRARRRGIRRRRAGEQDRPRDARRPRGDPGARARRRVDSAVEPGDAAATSPKPARSTASTACARSRSAGPGARLSLGEAITWLNQVVAQELPEQAQIDWKGESREYQQAGGAVLLTFALALLVVYLVLAAQFESFIHPLRDHADRAAGRARRADRVVGHRRHAQPLQPDRHRDAGGPGGEERHPDRRVRQPAARRGPQRARGDRRVVGACACVRS